MDKRTFVALAIILAGVSYFLFNSFYTEAEKSAITKLNEEQTVLAELAVRGINDFFERWTQNLNAFAMMGAIIDNDTRGKSVMKFLCEANKNQIKAITRLDERGVVLYSFPSIEAVGTDISDQKHVRELLRDHKPVISDVLRAAEEFDSVALHVPVFRGSEFKGSIGILIDVESLAKRYLDVIKIGETGYAWVVSRDGTLLYSPVPGATGESVFEAIKESPSLIAMASDMLKGHAGTATYNVDRTGDRDVRQTTKYAVYMPIRLGNTFWSIAVASAEQDVLSGLTSFRNKLTLVIGALFMCGMLFSTLGTKAWLIVNEEKKRRKMEDALRESEARLRDIIFSMGDWVWEVDENGVYTYSSSKGEEHFGRVIGKTPFDFMPPEEAKRVVAIFSEIAAKKAPIKDLENWNVGKGGESICLLTNGVPVLDGEGNLRGYRGVDKDITEHKRADGALLASEERFRALAESALVGIYVLQDGKYAYVNPAMACVFGYSVSEMTGMSPREIVQPCDHGMVSENIRRRITGEVETVQYEVRGRHKDGSTRDVEVFGSRVEINGRPALIGTLIDITERNRAEEDLRASEERFRQFFKNVPDYCYIISPQGNILNINDSALHLLGYEREELVGKPLELIYAPESISKMKQLFYRWKEEGQLRNEEVVIITKDGEKRVVLLNAGSVNGKDGEVLYSTSVQTDITDRKQTEEALREREAALRYTQKNLQRLAGRLIFAQEEELRRLSRELHDDLTQRLAVLAIDAGKLELDLGKRPEACPEISREISQMKEQLISVSEDVHNISRQLHPTILDDLGLVRAIESECAAVMRRENIEIIFSKEDVPAVIGNDTSLCLYRVLQEGLKNVITHSRAKSCKIVLKGADDTVCLTVTDDGVGFNPVEVRHKPGLGLSSMRERVGLVDGDFSIKSQQGKGTVLNVRVSLTGGEA